MPYVEDIKENFKLEKPIGLGYSITVIDGKRCIVAGHKGIAEYSEEVISVRLKKGFVSIEGKELAIVMLSPSELYISGKIVKVEKND